MSALFGSSYCRLLCLRSLSNRPSGSVASLPHPKCDHYGVPVLQTSLQKYLQYTKPLVSAEQWHNTYKITKSFAESPVGAQLQELLKDRSRKEENWLFDWWLQSYLHFREPVVVHSSPGLRMKTMRFNSDREWLIQAVAIIQGVLNFKAKLETKGLKTDYISDGGSPLCMSQYYAVLANCRIPWLPHDRILTCHGEPSTTVDVDRLSVLYRNRLFDLVFADGSTGEPLPTGLIYRQLEHIVHAVQSLPTAVPIGLLTSLPRDDWANAHAELQKSFVNANNLSSVERSLFVLCLDDSANLPPAEQSTTDSQDSLPARDTISALNVLHGSLLNSGNRWFDKTVQFVVSRDGSVGLNFEHTPSDAGPHLALVEEVYAAMAQTSVSEGQLPLCAVPSERVWDISTHISDEVYRAGDVLKKLVDSVAAQYGVFRTFGSSAIKRLGLSPDAFFQVALQLAYARLHPDTLPPPTYESGSLRRFHLGRTDTIRSCSQETVAFTQSMANPNCSTHERSVLLRQAVDRHQQYTRDVTDGKAFDRHLLGLRLLSASLKSTNPLLYEHTKPFFEDPTYKTANHYLLSTSQTRSEADLAVIFGPVVPNGYGVCYNIHRNFIQLNATSFRSSSETREPRELVEQLFIALKAMISLAVQSS